MLLDQIKQSAVEALKSGDRQLQGALKLLVSEAGYVAGPDGIVTDEMMMKLLQREAKKRKESIEIYEKAGDTARTDQEKYELTVIEKYLPTMMPEAELSVIVDEVAAGGKRGGVLIGEVMGRVRGKADGGMVSRLVMQKYAA